MPPEAGEHEIETLPSTMSLAIGTAYATVAPDGPVASAIRLACAAITGATESLTKTAKVEVAAFPVASRAEHST